jgi:DnaK suppressor protein
MGEFSMPLTEAQLLAMPESDYMNDVQAAFFRERLQAMREELQRKVDETVEHMREQETVADPADRATVEEEHALELRTRDRERKLLKKIDQALERIADDSYGYCEETGEPIGLARLLARPTATLSVEAQARRERLQKLYAD